MSIKNAMILVVAGLVMTGCNRSLSDIAPSSQAPQALPAAPTQPVETANQLPPPSGANEPVIVQQSAPAAPTAPEVQVAEVTPEVAAPKPTQAPVTREGVSGAWDVKSDNPNCRMILAFTKWSGGYRATSLRCNSPELSKVSSWDVKGKQVVLMDGSGNTLARLYNSGGNRYDGQSNSGTPVTLSRS